MEKPLVIDAIIGNARLLATLDRRGELHHLYWPDIDRDQQVGQALLGLFAPGRWGEPLWLSGYGWQHQQRYQGDNAVLHTAGRHPEAGFSYDCVDFCVPGRSLLVRRLRVVNRGPALADLVFLHYGAFTLGGAAHLNSCYFHPGASALVYFRQDTVCAVGLDRPVTGFTCGRRNTPGSALLDAGDGHLEGRGVEMGEVDACLASSLGRVGEGEAVELNVFWSFARDRRTALAELEEARREGAEALNAETARFWEQWLARGERHPSGDPLLDRVFRRSLIVMKLLSDAEHGGIIAAPETDLWFVGSGGYGYCWPRDAVWVATAFTEAGHPAEAAAFYRWSQRTQEPDGSWYQRYYSDGSLAPSWGLLQGDETAGIVFGALHHFALTRNRAFLHELWPTLSRAADFLVRHLDPHTGLAGPSIDLWEERTEESAYTSAAYYGGLVAAAYLAREVADLPRAERYEQAAARVKTAIETELWYPPDQRFLRGVLRRIGFGEYLHRRGNNEEVCQVEPHGPYRAYAERRDRGLDASLLGLSVPFGVFFPSDPRMVATADQIARHLVNDRVGGIHRYTGDGYRGGNPWVVCTLWLGLYELALGQTEKARQRLAWAAEHRTVLDLLPEQVCGQNNCPLWIIPLGWSHAMYVHSLLALRRHGAFAPAQAGAGFSPLAGTR